MSDWARNFFSATKDCGWSQCCWSQNTCCVLPYCCYYFNWIEIQKQISDQLLFAGSRLWRVFGVLDRKIEEDDDNAAGGTNLRPFSIVVLVNCGLATTALPLAARSSGVAACPVVSRVPDDRRLFSHAVSATCFSILPLALFLPVKTWPTSDTAASNRIFQPV